MVELHISAIGPCAIKMELRVESLEIDDVADSVCSGTTTAFPDNTDISRKKTL